ncbi:AAA family ATPase [Pontiella sp.]|uniref:AAA family ATPase n=1 Tax=Pontiella sp. TaxID=2837462 RepID=UPI00356A50BE
MTKAILISIHPEHVANILNGTKVFEYRKVMPTRDVSHMVLYCTTPIKRVVAVAEIVGRLVGAPSRIWSKTAYASGITRKFYRNYFSGQENAGAFELGNVYKLSDPLELSKLTSCKVAPQSFCYLNTRDTKLILQRAAAFPATQPSFLFVGGIHGVGKTTICQKAFAPLGYCCMTASSLMASDGPRPDKNKRVDDVPGNQTALIEQLSVKRQKHNRLLLDGHFTVLNRLSKIEPINISVFQEMNPSGLLLIKGDSKEISVSLSKRDGEKWTISFLKSLQRAEELHARKVAIELNIPLRIVNRNDKPVSIAKIASSIGRTDQP